jgi:hypothetical protein
MEGARVDYIDACYIGGREKSKRRQKAEAGGRDKEAGLRGEITRWRRGTEHKGRTRGAKREPEGGGQMGGTVVVMAVDGVVAGNRARRGERTNARSASEPRHEASDRRAKRRRGNGSE